MNAKFSKTGPFKEKFRQKFAFLYNRHSLFYYSLFLIGTGVAFCAIALLCCGFTTPYSGDYSQQFVPFTYNFYDDWWTFFKTGKFPLFDMNTYLGADNVLANTYYGLFSPFLFPLLFFPRVYLQQGMAIMLIAKFVVGALFFRILLKYMGTKEQTARIFSFAYAFMGWTAYYLWFNTFAEAMVFLPLIILGIEKVIKEKKIWVVSLGFFFVGIGNYYFLLTFGVFGVIYALFRFCQTSKGRNVKDSFAIFGLGVLGFALGYLMCAVVTFPAVFSSFGIQRSTSSQYLSTLSQAWNDKDFKTFFSVIFTWWNPSIWSSWHNDPKIFYFCFGYPLAEFFFPAISGRFVNFIRFSSFENVGSSMFIYTPYLIFLGLSLFRSLKNKKVSHFIALGVIIFCLFCPFVYWMSGGFAVAYGRWQIVVPAVTLIYIALNYDYKEEFSKKAIAISGGVAVAFMVLTFLLSLYISNKFGSAYGDTEYVRTGFGSVCSIKETIALLIYELSLAIAETILFTCIWKKPSFNLLMKIMTIAEIVVIGNVVTIVHGIQPYWSLNGQTAVNGGHDEFVAETEIISLINKNDSSFFRILNTRQVEGQPNLSQAEGYNGSSTFHTFYNTEVDDFVRMQGIACHSESWSGFNYAKHAYVNEFLGNKYLITKDSETSYFYDDGSVSFFCNPNVPLNYELNEEYSINGYRVYENKYQINFATSYDTMFYKHVNENDNRFNAFYNDSNYNIGNTNFIRNDEALFKGVILNDDDLDEIRSEHPDINYSETMPGISAKKLQVKNPQFYVLKNEDGSYGYFDPNSPLKDTTLLTHYDSEINANHYQIVYESSTGSSFQIGSKGGYYLLSYPVRNMYAGGKDYGAAVWAIDESGNVITLDDARYQGLVGGNAWRAIYSEKPIKKFVICPLSGEIYTSNISIYYQPFEDVLDVLTRAKANSVNNVTYNVNDFTFNTNYSNERIVVTQVAYTSGWKVEATNQGVTYQLKTYNMQGGFLGFVAPKGDTNYKITYLTPGMNVWGPVSLIAWLTMLGVTFTPIIIKKRKQKRI